MRCDKALKRLGKKRGEREKERGRERERERRLRANERAQRDSPSAALARRGGDCCNCSSCTRLFIIKVRGPRLNREFRVNVAERISIHDGGFAVVAEKRKGSIVPP